MQRHVKSDAIDLKVLLCFKKISVQQENGAVIQQVCAESTIREVMIAEWEEMNTENDHNNEHKNQRIKEMSRAVHKSPCQSLSSCPSFALY